MSKLISRVWHEKNFLKFSRFLIRNVYWFLAAAVLITAVAAYGASRIRIDSDYMAFLPDSFPGVQNLKRVITKTGSFGNFIVVLEGATPEARREFAKQFAEPTGKLPWVDYVEYKKDREKIEKNKLLYVSLEDLQEIHQRVESQILQKKNPMLISFDDAGQIDFSDIERKYQATSFGSAYFEDPAQLYTAVIIWPKGSMTNIDLAKKGYAELEGIVKDLNPGQTPGLKVGIGGEFRTKIDEYNSLIGDVYSSSFITLGGILLLLFFFYRKKRALFSVLIPLIMGIIWTIGLSYLLVGRLNLLTVFLVAILLGLGMDYGIYLFSRYVEERSKGSSLEKTIAIVLYDTGRATLSSALATSIAFLTLTFTDFKGFQEFGLLSSLGVVIIFIAFLIGSPILWILTEKMGVKADKQLRAAPAIIRRLPLSKAFVWIGFLVALLGLLALPFIQFEYDYANLRSKKSSYWQLASKIHEVFPLSKTPAVVITDTLEEAKEVVEAVKSRIKGAHTIDTVKSIVDFMPDELQKKKLLLASIKSMVDKNKAMMSEKDRAMLDDYVPYLTPDDMNMNDVPRSMLRQFTGLPNTEGHLVFIYDKVRLSDARNAMQYADEIREIETPEGKKFYPAEGSLLFADALRLMIKEAHIAFWVMLLGVYLILCWDFRDYKKAAIVILPLCMGLTTTFAVMWLFNVKINIFNLVIFPILIGIGMDSTIHLYHRFLEGFKEGTLPQIIRATANPLLLATLTNMLGFGSTLNSDHQGLVSIGVVAIIGLCTQLAASLLFFPAFLHLIAKRKGY